MKDLFIEKSLDFYLTFLKMNKKKFWVTRVLLAFFFFLFFIVIFLKIHNIWLVIAAPIVSYVGYKLPYWKLISMKNRIEIVNSFLFPHFLRTFLSLLGTQGNVFQTLVATIPYLEEPLKSEVEQLVEKIENRNDREYYLEFAKYIGSNEAYLIMSMIYEFSMVGTNKSMLTELERYIESIQQNKTQELKGYKIVRMEKNANIPLVSTVVFMLIFTLSVMYYFVSNLGTNF